MRTYFTRYFLVGPMAVSVAVIALSWMTDADPRGIFPRNLVRWLRPPAATEADASGHSEESAWGHAVAEASKAFWGGRGDDPRGPSRQRHESARPGVLLPGVAGAERSDYGSLAMKLPERLADAFSGHASTATLQAPRREEARELAGSVMRNSHPATDSGSGAAAGGGSVPQTWVPERTLIHRASSSARARGSALASSAQRRSAETPQGDAAAAMSLSAPYPRTAAGAALSETASGVLVGARAVAAGSGAGGRRLGPLPGDAHRAAGLRLVTGLGDSPANGGGRERRAGAASAGKHAGGPGGWPTTRALNDQLDTLAALAVNLQGASGSRLVSVRSSENDARRWANQVADQLEKLQSLRRLGDPRAGELIRTLARDAADGIQSAEQLEDREQQLEWLRAAHALSRRAAVWQPVWEVAQQGRQTTVTAKSDRTSNEELDRRIARLRGQLEQTGDPNGWADYLLLDDIRKLADSDHYEQRALVAQRLLSRLNWHGLTDAQRQWLSGEGIAQIAEAVRPWARTPIDYARLVAQLERQESNAIDLASIDIADAVQALRFAEDHDAAQVADSINTHYRNANVRFAVRDAMLQRLLPTIEPKTMPVRETILGNRVRGHSRVESDLRLQLRPSLDRWSLRLQTEGNVDTHSVGTRGPVAVTTRGEAEFSASTPIEINRRGVRLDPSRVDVQGRNRLRGIRTDFDRWPLIGPLVRSVAQARFEAMAPRSEHRTEHKIGAKVRRNIDQRVETQIDDATDRVSRAVLGPLGELELDPMVVDMETTESRLIARYRLAGDWQLAAFTPRPRAPQSSLMSLQVHQSALNNTLEQLLPRDRPKSIKAMVDDGVKLFGRNQADLPDDVPADVMIQFARTRPITVEVDNGRVWITMRIMQLTRDDSMNLSRFIVRAAYVPQIDGLTASLAREGHLRISGPNMSFRERLPVRAIFNKVLSPNHDLPLTLPELTDSAAAADLVVSQFELRDGWIAIAVSEQNAPRIALKRSQQEPPR